MFRSEKVIGTANNRMKMPLVLLFFLCSKSSSTTKIPG